MATQVKIASATVGSGGAASITFSSIPQNYTDLRIRLYTRSSTGETPGVLYFNSDTTDSNYYVRRMLGEGGESTGSTSFTNTPYNFYMATTSATANSFAIADINIPNYTSTTLYKTPLTVGATENNGSYAILQLITGRWMKSPIEAISAIQIRPYVAGGATFVEGCSFTLYGISKQ